MDTVSERTAEMVELSRRISKYDNLFTITLAFVACLEPEVCVPFIFITIISGLVFLFKRKTKENTISFSIDNNKAFLARKGLDFIPKHIQAFSVAKEIVYLDIRHNKIKDIDFNFFTLVNVKTLDISGNELSDVKLQRHRLPEKIEDIRFEYNAVEYFDISCETLKSIKAKGNSLCCFNGSDLETVTFLDLSYNSVTVIQPSICKMKNLKWLNFEGNLISAVPVSFCELKKLTYLNLMRNTIETLPLEFSSMECLASAELNLRHNKLVYPPQYVCDAGFEKIKAHMMDRDIRKRKKSINETFFKVAIISEKDGASSDYHGKKVHEYTTCTDCFGNDLYVYQYVVSPTEKCKDIHLFIFMLEVLSNANLDTLFSNVNRIKKFNPKSKIAVVCDNLAPVMRQLQHDNLVSSELCKVAQTMGFIQEKIQRLKSSAKHLTTLDYTILESLYLARAKYQTILPCRNDIIWYFKDRTQQDCSVNDIIRNLVSIPCYIKVRVEPIDEIKPVLNGSEKLDSLGVMKTGFSIKIQTVYQTQSDRSKISESIRNNFGTNVIIDTTTLIAVENDNGVVQVKFLENGDIHSSSEGNDLNIVWKGTLHMNKTILESLDRSLLGAWIICPSCNRKHSNRPCKWPIELLDIDGPRRWSYTGCDQESSSFVIPVSRVYPMHKVGQIWEDWQKLIVLPQSENTIMYPAFENNNPDNQLILVLSRQWIKPENIDIKTEILVKSTRRSQESLKIFEFIKSHRCNTVRNIPCLKQRLSKHCDRLFEKHSNLNMIKYSPFKSLKNGDEIVECSCIVFICHKKGYIPLGETVFPKSIDGIPTDVREGSLCMTAFRRPVAVPPSPGVDEYNDPLHMGCSISRRDVDVGFGTIGPFVKDDQGRTGFLTCCHSLFTESQLSPLGIDVVQPAIVDFNDKESNTEDDPVTVERKKNDLICGQVRKSMFGNGEVDGEEYAMDVAFVEVTRRMPSTLRFAGMKPSVFSHIFSPRGITQLNLDMNEGLVSSIGDLSKEKNYIYKCGASTKMRIGDLDIQKDENRCLYVRLTPEATLQSDCGHSFVGKNIMIANRVENENAFVEKGDSGAVVFHITPDQKIKALGIVLAISDEDLTYMIMPLEPILKYHKFEMLKLE